MTRLRSRSIRYIMVSLLTMSLLPWVGHTWVGTSQGPSGEARGTWLHDRIQERIDAWPSEADRDAFQRAVADTPVHAWTPPEQFTASVLRAYESYAPDGHTAADLLGHQTDADAATLAHWLHYQDSQWGHTAPLPRIQAAAVAALSTARAALGAVFVPPHRTPPVWQNVRVVAHSNAHAGRWLIRCLVQATPRAP